MAIPTDVAGLAAWWKADAITGLADNDPVSTWPDSSGNARDLTGALTVRPTWQTNEINGLPVVRFDGVNDVLSNATAFLTGTSGSLFVVAKLNAALSGAVFLASGDVASAVRFMALRTSATATHFDKPATVQRNNDTTDAVRGNTALGTTDYHVIAYHSSGTAYTIEIDNVALGLTVELGANSGDWFGDTTALDNTTMGALVRSTTDSFLSADVAEEFVFDGVTLSATDKALMYGYLYTRYFWERPVVIGAPSQAAQRAGSW